MPRKCQLVQHGDRKLVRPQKWANGHFLHKNYFRCRNPAARTPPALRKVGARLAVGWPPPCGRLARCLLLGRLLLAAEQPPALPPVKFLSHTYGMGIVVCHCSSHRNGWLPIFDAYGIFRLSIPHLWLVCYAIYIRTDAEASFIYLSHTYGMGIFACHYSSHRNGWLPIFDAYGIFRLSIPHLWLVCYAIYIATDAVRHQILVASHSYGWYGMVCHLYSRRCLRYRILVASHSYGWYGMSFIFASDAVGIGYW